MSVNHQRLGTNRYHLPRSAIIAPPLKPRSFALSDVQPLLSTPMVGSRTSLIPAVLDNDTLDSLVPPLTPFALSRPEHGSKPEHRMRRDMQRLRLRHSHSPDSVVSMGRGKHLMTAMTKERTVPRLNPPWTVQWPCPALSCRVVFRQRWHRQITARIPFSVVDRAVHVCPRRNFIPLWARRWYQRARVAFGPEAPVRVV